MNNLLYFFHAGGFVMWPLLALSLACGVVIIERALAFRQLGNLAPQTASQVRQLCMDGQFEEALALCRKTSGPVAASMATAIERRHEPIERIERWVEETGQEYFLRLERGLPLLDTTTTVSPLLGLLGTILGMIGAFNAISVGRQGGNVDTVLQGVGEALYATAAGITVALICFLAYNAFAARLHTIQGETEMAVTKLLNILGDSVAVEAR
jgi:biopolymer transport protein ExbB